MSLILGLLLQVAGTHADPLADGNAALKKTIVDAIRNCPASADGTVAVCARDRGYAEGSGRRLQKLQKPKVPTSGPAITVTVGDGQQPAAPRDEDERIDARTRSRLTGKRE